MGKIYYLMGKSAAGKDKLYQALLGMPELSLRPLVLYTTRPMRTGETDGVQYHFTDEAGLAVLEQAGRVIELRAYDTVMGIWKYFTADDKHIDLARYDYLGIGTLESFVKVRDYYGPDRVAGLYIETDDGIRLARALHRERKQEVPHYEEMCRRFLADQKDFSPERIEQARVNARFSNDGDLEECLEALRGFILEDQGGAAQA